MDKDDRLWKELQDMRSDNTTDHNRIFDKLDSLTSKFVSSVQGKWLFVLVIGSFAFTASAIAYFLDKQ